MTEMVTRAERERLRAFFPDTGDTLMNACLQGHMGQAAAGAGWAALLAGDFAFLGGEACREGLDWLDENKPGLLILSGNAAWLDLAAGYAHRSPERAERYAFDVPARWDTDRLRALAAAVPSGVEILPMDGAWFAQCRQEEQLYDLCGPFADMPAFAAHGAGRVAVRAGRVMAGAGTYAWADGSIEVEIDTLPAYRRQGLATACGAALILDCLDRGLRPHWDAANDTSRRLALRLGYPPPRPYEVVEWA